MTTEKKSANTTTGKKRIRAREGIVVSDKMAKTIVVKVERQVQHPKYGKFIRKVSKHYAHDEQEAASVGDIVLIRQCRPLSRTKRWELESVVRKAS